MKIYKDFIIVKALNRDRDLGLRIIKNKLYDEKYVDSFAKSFTYSFYSMGKSYEIW